MEAVIVHRVGFLEYFCPKQGQDFEPSAAPIYPNMGKVTPPGCALRNSPIYRKIFSAVTLDNNSASSDLKKVMSQLIIYGLTLTCFNLLQGILCGTKSKALLKCQEKILTKSALPSSHFSHVC